VPFLGRRARLLPGAVTLARLTGAPLLMTFMYRSADYRHQVLEISAPVQCPAEEDAATAFARCAAEVSAAIRRSPAHWVYWASNGDLANLGLLSPDRDEAPAIAPILLTAQGFLRDGSADSVTTRGRPVPAARSRRLWLPRSRRQAVRLTERQPQCQIGLPDVFHRLSREHGRSPALALRPPGGGSTP
jgi:Bacterial lipid A biosynthesis acyltransferase